MNSRVNSKKKRRLPGDFDKLPGKGKKMAAQCAGTIEPEKSGVKLPAAGQGPFFPGVLELYSTRRVNPLLEPAGLQGRARMVAGCDAGMLGSLPGGSPGYLLPRSKSRLLPFYRLGRRKGIGLESVLEVIAGGSRSSFALEVISSMLGGIFGGGGLGGGRAGQEKISRREGFGFPGGGVIEEILEGLERVEQRHREMIERISGGNRKALGGISGLFEQLAERLRSAAGVTGKVFEKLQGNLFSSLGAYATRLGFLTGLASKAFTALRTMNPFAAAAASMALLALGQALKRLASGAGGAAGVSPGSTAAALQPASSGAAGSRSAVNSDTWRAPRVVNIYINGLKSGSSLEVDRTLGRAGIDRELRQRIQELVRTGANPVREY